MLIPTGVDCAIGGHAGDATPAARLLASVCDHLVLHPNVVNASDVNEQTENCLYVEGSLICRLMMGTIGLRKVRQNRVLLVTEERPRCAERRRSDDQLRGRRSGHAGHGHQRRGGAREGTAPCRPASPSPAA